MLDCCPKLAVIWRKLKTASGPAAVVATLAMYGFLMFQTGVASNYPKYSQHQSASNPETKSGERHPPKSLWTPDDSAGFFTLWIAAFTGVLALSTIFLWRATRDAAIAGKIAAEHISRTERGYIYGGFGVRYPVRDNGQEAFLLRVTMANYGKTPCFITKIKVGKGRIDNLPDEPVFEQTFDILDLYFPSMTMGEVRTTKASIFIPTDGKHVAFQRVFYTDVLGKEHFSGSIYRFYPTIAGIADEPVKPDSAYWCTDETEPPKQ